MTVYTGCFYILEGLISTNGEIACLAVSYDLGELTNFILEFAEKETPTQFDMFRITGHDGLDAILASTKQDVATHPAPLTSN